MIDCGADAGGGAGTQTRRLVDASSNQLRTQSPTQNLDILYFVTDFNDLERKNRIFCTERPYDVINFKFHGGNCLFWASMLLNMSLVLLDYMCADL